MLEDISGTKVRNICNTKLVNLKLTVIPRVQQSCKGASITVDRWRKHFSHLLNVHGVNYVRQTDIQTAEPLEHDPNAFEVKMGT
jgi:hypothetical protein